MPHDPIPTPELPAEPAMPPKRPATSIRTDREQIEAVLEPVVSAISQLAVVVQIVSRQQVEAVNRLAVAMEAGARQAARQRPRN